MSLETITVTELHQLSASSLETASKASGFRLADLFPMRPQRADSEGATLLVIEKLSGRAIGLMILFEMQANVSRDMTDVRLGYLLSEDAWGKGFATELVSGFVNWCRGQSSIMSIAGGVERDNQASIRVLEKTGFQLVPNSVEGGWKEMILKACAFETGRLLVKEWHSFSPSDWQEQELASVIVAILTEPVTHALPASWQGSYTEERANEWIIERDSEGATLLVIEKLSGRAIGLMILFEMQANVSRDMTDVRLGYLLSEDAWGKGFATELVSGFVNWCRGQSSIMSIAGGVERDNQASIRVLEKTGFQLVPNSVEMGQDELFYQLNLR